MLKFLFTVCHMLITIYTYTYIYIYVQLFDDARWLETQTFLTKFHRMIGFAPTYWMISPHGTGIRPFWASLVWFFKLFKRSRAPRLKQLANLYMTLGCTTKYNNTWTLNLSYLFGNSNLTGHISYATGSVPMCPVISSFWVFVSCQIW